MPVCARCTGIYAGAAVTAIVATVRTLRPPSADTWVGPYDKRTALVLAGLPTILTLVYEWTTGQTPANWIRAAAGVPIGVVVAWIVCGLRPEAVEG